jgi:vacuolar iron transporter family protein
MQARAPPFNVSCLAMEEEHRSRRAGWLRAAVLGADDGIVSISSLMIGVAASSASKEAILVAGVAGLVAGAMSMAVGEYVSVSAQRDAEQADVGRETRELAGQPKAVLNELALIYVKTREGTRDESRGSNSARATDSARTCG